MFLYRQRCLRYKTKKMAQVSKLSQLTYDIANSFYELNFITLSFWIRKEGEKDRLNTKL